MAETTKGRILFSYGTGPQEGSGKAQADNLAKLCQHGDLTAITQIMDAGWPSFVLSHWIRDAGLYSLGEGVRRLTSGPARVLGLKDRGRLASRRRGCDSGFRAKPDRKQHMAHL